LKKIFFGYLSNNKVIRAILIILIAISPIVYYKTISGVFIEDIIAMYWYGDKIELIYFWISGFLISFFISYFYYICFIKK
jgi:hypothetical protein